MRVIVKEQSDNQKAFTLIETVLALFMTSIIVHLLSGTIGIVISINEKQSNRYVEWLAFTKFIDYELSKGWISQLSSGDRLVIVTPENKESNQVIYIEKYNAMLRKTTSNGGHEPLLKHVVSVSFIIENQTLAVRVQLTNREVYSRVFFVQKE